MTFWFMASLPGAPNAWAAKPVGMLDEYPEDLTYKEIADPSPTVVENEVQKIESLALAQGLESIGTDENGVRTPVLGMDDVFANFECDQMLEVKFGALPAQKRYLNQLIVEGPRTLLFHGITGDGVPYGIYTSNVDTPRSHDFMDRLMAALSVKSPRPEASAARAPSTRMARAWQAAAHLGDHLFPSAEAAQTDASHSSCAAKVPAQVDGKDLRKSLTKSSPTHQFVRVTIACLKGVKDGVLEATIGAVGGLAVLTYQIGKGVFHTIHHPFDAVHQAVDYVASFPKKVMAKFREKKDEVKKNTLEDWSHLFCEVGSKVGVGIALSMLAAGQLPASLSSTQAAKVTDIFQKMDSTGGALNFFLHPEEVMSGK